MTREEAIDVLEHNYPSACYTDLCEAVEIAIQALSAQSEQRWITCSERLPQERQWVLCFCRAGIMDVLRLTNDGSWNKNYPHVDYMSGFVVAWMPLPEPYRGEGEANG